MIQSERGTQCRCSVTCAEIAMPGESVRISGGGKLRERDRQGIRCTLAAFWLRILISN
jgi:hypothetical protein